MLTLESVKPILGEYVAGVQIEKFQGHPALIDLIKRPEHQGEASALRPGQRIDVDAFQTGIPAIDLGLTFQRIDQ